MCLLIAMFWTMSEGISSFKTNIMWGPFLWEEVQSSYRAYYFRGETYREKGEVEKAIESYSKALEINPDFSAAKKKLDELKDR